MKDHKMQDNLLGKQEDVAFLDKFELGNIETSSQLNSNRCCGINPGLIVAANSVKLSVFFLITYLINIHHQKDDAHGNAGYLPSYTRQCSAFAAENSLPGILSWILLIASSLFYCIQRNTPTAEKNNRQHHEKLTQSGLLPSSTTLSPQRGHWDKIILFSWAYYTVGSLLSASSPSPSETGYPPACNTMLNLSLETNNSNDALTLFHFCAINTILLAVSSIALTIGVAFYDLIKRKKENLPKTQTEWPVNLDLLQLKKIKSSLYALKKDNLSFDTCPIYFLHNQSIPELDRLISNKNVFLAPDYVNYNTKNFIKWIKHSRSINQTSLCSPIDPSINIQFTTNDMTHLKEHINSNYGSNQSFVNFFKSTTCPITQDEIQDNAIEVNSTTTYDEEAIIEYIAHELRGGIAVESIVNPETRQPISTIRYNASFTVFKHLAPKNDTKKENTANGRQELANDWVIDIHEEDARRFA